MNIAVFGAGGVGGLFGAMLARAGENVVFIARGENLKALRDTGLRVDTLDGQSWLLPVRAVGDPSEAGPVDAVLVCVKAWQVPEAARALTPLIGPDTFVVPLQNGVEAPSELSRVLGASHVLGGLCYLVTFLVGPGHVRHAGMEPRVLFGEQDNRVSERAGRLLDAFRRAGINTEIPADIHGAMWAKFLFIASFSGTAAVTRVPAGILRTVPETRELLTGAATEVYRVARAMGVTLAPDAVQTTLAVVDRLPEDATASMQRDIMDGRPSELSAQTGAVVRLGREKGVPTPVNSFLYASLLPLEKRARGEISF